MEYLYVVKSNRSGVSDLKKMKIIKIINKVEKQLYPFEQIIDRYVLDSNEFGFGYNMEIDMGRGDNFSKKCGHGTGFGDLWEWTYYASIHENDAKEWMHTERKRITEKYLNKI